jgi:uncharacterized protein DUF6438
MLLQIIFCLSPALLGTSAGGQGASHSAQTVIPQDIPQDLKITLERAGCFGFCPNYILTITADGAIVFEGGTGVKQEGATIKSAISQDRLKQLMAEFYRVKFFSLEDDYLDDPRVCAENWTDAVSAFTSIRIYGKSKTVRHYYGCKGPKVPRELTDLENKIDEIVNTAQWFPNKKAR